MWRQGLIDHKGFEGISNPIFNRLESEIGFKCALIHNAHTKLSNSQVLSLISHSNMLIQASSIQEAGLPCREALGLGTCVLTTNVSIVSELHFSESNIFQEIFPLKTL